MFYLNVSIFIFVVILVLTYFLAYKRIKDKIFSKLIDKVDQITSFDFELGRDLMHFERREGYWEMTQPTVWRANTVKIRKLFNKLDDLKILHRNENAKIDDPDFGIGKNGYLTIYYGNSATKFGIGLRTRSSDDMIYITKSGDNDILSVSSILLGAFPRSIDDFKNTLIFEGYYQQVKALEAGTLEKRYVLMRLESGWSLKGKNVFDDKVEPLITGLLEMEATGFESDDYLLPAKPSAFISLKINKTLETRHFFENGNDTQLYLMPFEGRILKLRKVDIDKVIDF